MAFLNIIFILLATLAGLSASIGDAMLSQWAKIDNKAFLLLGGFLFWNISLLLFIGMLKREQFSTSVVFFVISNYIISIAISQFIFHEHISIYQKIAIVLALTALALM